MGDRLLPVSSYHFGVHNVPARHIEGVSEHDIAERLAALAGALDVAPAAVVGRQLRAQRPSRVQPRQGATARVNGAQGNTATLLLPSRPAVGSDQHQSDKDEITGSVYRRSPASSSVRQWLCWQ